MNKTTPFITYAKDAEKAVSLYVSLIKNSKINGMIPGPNGTYSLVFFELDGRPYTAMNGGSTFTFASGFSIYVECEDQKEVDLLWNGLCANGGQEGRCGWLKDAWGLSWQIIPRRFMELMSDKDPKRVQRTMNAMLKMNKLIVSELESAANG
ncbi:MAG: VOC family protein [Leptospiraceae bacterium]|nr:VOC family protein [Leptospiraceae bacterium]